MGPLCMGNFSLMTVLHLLESSRASEGYAICKVYLCASLRPSIVDLPLSKPGIIAGYELFFHFFLLFLFLFHFLLNFSLTKRIDAI